MEAKELSDWVCRAVIRLGGELSCTMGVRAVAKLVRGASVRVERLLYGVPGVGWRTSRKALSEVRAVVVSAGLDVEQVLELMGAC